MDAERKVFGAHEFWLVGLLQLRRTVTGQLEEYTHTLDPSVRTNPHADGPFCSFSLPHAPRAAGVYAIEVGGELKYVGECEDLASRFSSTGYGKIAPRNCHRDGQSTNCKLNARILAAAKEGKSTAVWFCPTSEYKTVEQLIIRELSPVWNGPERRASPRPRSAGGSQRLAASKPQQLDGNEGPPSTADFKAAIGELLQNALRDGRTTIAVNAGELHRLVGGYPTPYNRMPMCCAAMRAAMEANDRFLYQPPKGNGAKLTIEYQLPRSGYVA